MGNTVIDLSDFEKRMQGACDVLDRELQGLRTGRASVNLLDSIFVEVYGSRMPLNQLSSVSTPEARLITVQVWDTSNVKSVEKAIANSGLGLNPQPAGNMIRIPLPELSEERRLELVKVAGKYAEQAKVAIRNVRRDAMDLAKKQEKEGNMSEDDLKRAEDEIEKMTKGFVESIDKNTQKKEEEIKQV